MNLSQDIIDSPDKKGLEFTFIDNDNKIVYFTSKYGLKEYVQVNGVKLASKRVKSFRSSGFKFSSATGGDYEVIAKIRYCECRLYKDGKFIDGYKMTHKRITEELGKIIPIVTIVLAFIIIFIYQQLIAFPIAFAILIINRIFLP